MLRPYFHLSVQDEDALNRVLWHNIKGAQTPIPASRTIRYLPIKAARSPLRPLSAKETMEKIIQKDNKNSSMRVILRRKRVLIRSRD